MTKPFKNVKKVPGRKPTIPVDEVNRIADTAQRLTKLTAIPPLELVTTAGGTALCLNDEPFFARLLPDRLAPPGKPRSSSSASSKSQPSNKPCWVNVKRPWSWEEVYPNPSGGGWTAPEGARQGYYDSAPGYELNNQCVPLSTVVQMFPGADGEVLFDYCCGSTPTSTSSSA